MCNKRDAASLDEGGRCLYARDLLPKEPSPLGKGGWPKARRKRRPRREIGPFFAYPLPWAKGEPKAFPYGEGGAKRRMRSPSCYAATKETTPQALSRQPPSCRRPSEAFRGAKHGGGHITIETITPRRQYSSPCRGAVGVSRLRGVSPWQYICRQGSHPSVCA